MFGQLGNVEQQLAAVVAELNPDAVATPALVPLFEQLDRIERLAATAKTLLARRVEESREWARRGYASAAEFLAAKCGSSVGAAKDALATSATVAELPEVEQAMRDGQLSEQQAVLVADAAAAAPAKQSRLINQAKKSSLKELKDECQRTKAAADPNGDATHQRIHDERYLRTFTDKEGAWNRRARAEGCYRTRCEIDHREPFAQTKHTRLDQCDPLCKPHHDLKTYNDWALIEGTGKRPIVPPDNPKHPNHTPPP